MGGGHGHHEPFEVPHYTTYANYTKCPELMEHQKRLARLGLKDPWIRNYAHLYKPHYARRGHLQQVWHTLKPGFWLGLGLAAGVIVIEESYSYFKHGHTSWAGGH